MNTKFLLVIFSIFFIFNLVSVCMAQQQQYLTVISYIGKAEYRVGFGNWIQLQVGDQVPSNAVIRVLSKDDSIEFNLPNGSVITIPGGTSSIKASEILKDSKLKTSSNSKDSMQIASKSEVAAVRGAVQSSSVFANVTSLKGTAQKKMGQGAWANIRPNSLIPVGSDVSINGVNDLITFRLPDSSTVKMTGTGSINLENLSAMTSNNLALSSIDLLNGKLFTVASPSSDQVLYIKTGSQADKTIPIIVEPLVSVSNQVKFGISYSASQGDVLVVSEGSAIVMASQGNFSNIIVNQGYKLILPSGASAAPGTPETAVTADIQQFDPNETMQIATNK